MRYDTYQIKAIRAIDSYKALVSKVRSMIMRIIHKEQGEAAAYKYLAKCAYFDKYTDKHGKPPFMPEEKEEKQEKEKKPRRKQGITIYVYDDDGNLINTFNSLYECSRHLLGKFQGVRKHFIGKVYHGYLLSGQMLTQEQAREMYMSADVIKERGKYKRGKR